MLHDKVPQEEVKVGCHPLSHRLALVKSNRKEQSVSEETKVCCSLESDDQKGWTKTLSRSTAWRS